MTTPRHTDRRTLLKTTGGLLTGTTVFTSSGAALPDQHGPQRLELDVRQDAINPDKEGLIPTRVTGPQELADHANFPGLVYFGHREQFITDGDTLFPPENPEEVLATPVRTRDVGGSSGDTFTNDMLYDTQDIDFSKANGEEVTMGAAIVDGIIDPGRLSDTDTVRLGGNPPTL